MKTAAIFIDVGGTRYISPGNFATVGRPAERWGQRVAPVVVQFRPGRRASFEKLQDPLP